MSEFLLIDKDIGCFRLLKIPDKINVTIIQILTTVLTDPFRTYKILVNLAKGRHCFYDSYRCTRHVLMHLWVFLQVPDSIVLFCKILES